MGVVEVEAQTAAAAVGAAAAAALPSGKASSGQPPTSIHPDTNLQKVYTQEVLLHPNLPLLTFPLPLPAMAVIGR